MPYTAVRVVDAGRGRGCRAAGGDDLLVNVEREHIQRALVRSHGNKKAAARMLGLSRRALYRRLERLDLGDTIMPPPRPDARRGERLIGHRCARRRGAQRARAGAAQTAGLRPRSWRAACTTVQPWPAHMHPTPPLLRAPSVLVVDDETGVREVMARWLASGGYDVRTAANADEALRRVARSAARPWRCATSGCPASDGLWLANQIRHDAPETAVIMATGVQDVGSAVTSLRQGVIDYLTKPFGRDRLREVGLARHRVAQGGARLAPLARSAGRGGGAAGASA